MKETLKEMIVRIIKEESGKVTAKPIAKKGQPIQVINLYNRKKEIRKPIDDAVFDDDLEEYMFLTQDGIVVTWDGDSWIIDPSYQD